MREGQRTALVSDRVMSRLFHDTDGSAILWNEGGNSAWNIDPGGTVFRWFHDKGINVARFDGSVEFFTCKALADDRVPQQHIIWERSLPAVAV